MDGAVKMPGVQANINAAGRAQSTQSSDSGIEFIRLMQEKNTQAKAAGQENTPQKAQNNAKQPSQDVRDIKDSTEKDPEISAEEPKTEDPVDTEEMAQQAAAQQTAALLAGMLTQTQEAAMEAPVPEETISAAGELLTTEALAQAVTPEMTEVTEVSTEASPLPEVAEILPEVTTESIIQPTPQETPVQETSVATEAAAQPEAPQVKAVNEAAQKEAKPAEAKAEKPETVKTAEKPETAANTDKVSDPLQNMSEENMSKEQKAEENPEPGKQTSKEEIAAFQGRKSEENRISESETGQTQATAGAESFRLFGQSEQNNLFAPKTENLTMKTTPETIPQDLGKTLGARLAEGVKTLTVELEPANLGKLTIHLTYEANRAAVSIMATNPKTLEILNQKASEIAAILEEKTGQETVIYTQKPESNQENYDRNPDGRREREEQEEQHQQKQKDHQSFDSFAQQLRLGLV